MIRSVKDLYTYCYDITDIDLEDTLIKGEMLTVDQITGYARWLRNGRLLPDNVVAIFGVNQEDEAMNAITWNGYLHWTKAFLLWAADTFIRDINAAEVRARFADVKDRLTRLFEHLSSKVKTSVATKGLSKVQMRQLLKVARPGSSLNPFKEESVQFRNWIVLQILYSTGMRRGDLLSALSEDKPTSHNNNKWLIRKRQADPKDLRNPRPSVKTSERDIQLLPKHSQMMKQYVDKYRWVYRIDELGRNKKRRPQHDFLFVSSLDGSPLSLDSINKMLDEIGKAAFPDGSVKLHPHLLRNTFCNEYMEEAVNYRGEDIIQAKDSLRRICGWSIKSIMPELYAAKWRQEVADAANTSLLLKREEQDLNNRLD